MTLPTQGVTAAAVAPWVVAERPDGALDGCGWFWFEVPLLRRHRSSTGTDGTEDPDRTTTEVR